MTATVFILAAYLIGSVSFAVIVSILLRLPDPHSYGSGNPGATNVLRTGNKLAALFTLLGDAAKGWFAVWLTLKLAPSYGFGTWVIAAVVVAVFVGHLFPVFHRFRGGKGVATALGTLVALSLPLAGGVVLIWLIVLLLTRYSSLAGLVAAIVAPLFTAHFLGIGAYALAVSAMALLLIWRHRSNIRKLLDGTERRVGKSRV